MRLSVPFLIVLAFAAGCGGGPGADDDEGEAPPDVLPEPPTQQVILLSDAGRDGYLVLNTGGTSTGGVLRVGDDAFFDNTYVGFLVFPLDGLPAGAQIVSATLQVDQLDVQGTPYTDLGSLRLTQVDIGVGLDFRDVTAPVIAPNVGTLFTDPALGVRTLDVTALVLSNLSAGRTRIDLRLEFDTATDADGQEDRVQLNDGWDSARVATPAKIVVEHR